MGALCKCPLAGIYALLRQIYDNEVITQAFEEPCPSPVSRGNLNDSIRWQKFANTRQNSTIPLHMRAAPRRGPLFAGLSPIIRLIPPGIVSFDGWHNLSNFACASLRRAHRDRFSTVLRLRSPAPHRP